MIIRGEKELDKLLEEYFDVEKAETFEVGRQYDRCKMWCLKHKFE